jgi:hypothetical protein
VVASVAFVVASVAAVVAAVVDESCPLFPQPLINVAAIATAIAVLNNFLFFIDFLHLKIY